MYSALTIARYIIDRETAQNRPVSNLRLQKLLYFIQAKFLISKGTPCFNDSIEAWDFGPVVPIVYHQFKFYGSSSIPCISEHTNTVKIASEDKQLIDTTLDQCAKYSTSSLVSITHQQQPWLNSYNNLFDKTISNHAIKSFFEE